MKSSRVPVLSGLLLMVCVMLAACGGNGTPPPPPQPLMVTTASPLTPATVNQPYTARLQASGGGGGYSWILAPGSSPLPPGLSIDGAHSLITGTPTIFGTFSFTVQVSDGRGNHASKDLSLMVGGALILSCDSCAPGTMTLPSGNPGVPYGPATVSVSGGLAPYTWCVTEAGGCGDGSQGGLPPGLTITTDANGNGVISGTPTTPGTPSSVTVQASDGENPPAHGTLGLKLTIIDIGTKELPDAMTFIPYSQNVVAIGGQGPYSWCVVENSTCDDGSHGALPTGLKLNPSNCVRSPGPQCTISGTPTETGTKTFTLQMMDGGNPPATASEDLSITVSNAVSNSLLNGHYALALNGFKNGAPYIMAAAFTADGAGNITGGDLDVNYGQGELTDLTQCRQNPNCVSPEAIQSSSSYDLTAGTGLGAMTINTIDVDSNPHTYKFELAVSSSACTLTGTSLSACGRLIQRDPDAPNTYGSGVLKVQNSAFFTVSSFFPGNFALSGSGIDPNGHRYAAVGAVGTNPTTRVDIDCNANGWGLNSCPLDQNDNGSAAANPINGTFSADLDVNTGRGNFVNLKFPNDPNGLCPGGLGNTVCVYSYYVVNKQEMILISGDPLTKPANLTLWTAYRQRSSANGWTLQQLSGNIITELTARDNGSPDVLAGILHADGAGNATLSADENDAGTLSRPSGQGTYAIDSTGNKTGKVTVSGFDQFGAGGATVYLYNGNLGYFLASDAKVTAGVLEGQTGSPFTNASVIGSLEGATFWPADTDITNSATWMFADGAGNITGKQYTSGPGGPGGPSDLALTYTVDATGRAVLQQNGDNTGFLYVIGPKKFVLLPTGNNPALSVFISGQPD